MRRGSRLLLLLSLLIRFAASGGHDAIDRVDAARHFRCFYMSSWSNFLVTIFFQSFIVKPPLVIFQGFSGSGSSSSCYVIVVVFAGVVCVGVC